MHIKILKVLLVKIICALSMFAISIYFARVYGASDAGVLLLAITLITVLSSVGRLGLDNVILKVGTQYKIENQRGKLNKLMFRAVFIVLAGSTLAVVLFYYLRTAFDLGVISDDGVGFIIYYISISAVAYACMVIFGELLKVLDYPGSAQLIQTGMIPLITLVVIWLASVNYESVMLVYMGITLTVSILVGVFVYLRIKIINQEEIKKESVALLRPASHLYAASLLDLTTNWFSTLSLGALASPADVAIFASAHRVSMLISFVLGAINNVMAPRFVLFFTNKNNSELSILAKKSATIASIVALPAFVVLLFSSQYVMSLFGDEFQSGSQILLIMAAGQVINAIVGSVNYLLMMTSHEYLVKRAVALGAALTIALNILLVPKLGILGAAISNAAGIAAINLLSLYYVKKYLGFWSLPFGVTK